MPRQKTYLGVKFGPVLKQLREESGLTQEALEEKTGYTRVQISYLETGITTPTLRTLLIFEMAFGVAPGELSRRVMAVLPAGWQKKGAAFSAPAPAHQGRPLKKR